MGTVNDMLRQVRDQIQEDNQNSVDNPMILDCLNRGQDYAADLLANNYPDPLIKIESATLNSDNTITLPENIFEERLQDVSVVVGSIERQLERINYNEVSRYTGSTGCPIAYNIRERKIYLYPANAASSYSYKIAYVREVEEMVEVYGRITSAVQVDGVANSYVTLDEAADSRITTSGAYAKYVNIVDSHTGEIKCTMQVNAIQTDRKKLTFKMTFAGSDRTTVLNRDIDDDLPDSVEPDDYICPVTGTGVLYFDKPMTNFVIQYAVLEIRRSLNYDISLEEKALSKTEEQVKDIWTNRKNTIRIVKKNPYWKSNRRI